MHAYPARASLQGLETEIFKLVSYSATPEQWREWLRVPLEHAAARGDLNLFNELLKAGADGGAGWRGCRGRTLLHAAAVGGNGDVMSTLPHGGCQPDVNVVSVSSKRSALYTATECGHEEAARLLVLAGADVNSMDPVDKGVVLHKAIQDGHAELVNYLLASGASPHARNLLGLSAPLHFAAFCGRDESVTPLLLKGADIDARDGEGCTPLIWAASQEHLSVVKTLLAAGANTNMRDSSSGYSALDYAVAGGYEDIMKALIARGADMHAGYGGATALHVAALNDQADAVHVLVEAGANTDVKTGDGRTPLSCAAAFGSCKAMLALLQRGASMTTRDGSGWAPLHVACSRPGEGLQAVVDLLLRWGADESELDKLICTPAEVLEIQCFRALVLRENFTCSQDEIERVSRLLARAPADRAWRRRGWVVMLRSRADKARTAISCDGGGEESGHGCIASDDYQRHAERCKAPKVQQPGGVAVVGSRADGERDAWSEMATSLTKLKEDGVFRAIVSFL